MPVHRQPDLASPALVQTDGEGLESILQKASKQGFGLVVVDSAPHNTDAAITCAHLSDMVLIPTRPAILDLDAIGATTVQVDSVGTPAEIVLNACPPPTRFGEPQIVSEAREALKVYDIPVCDVAISQRAAFSHALIDGRAVSEFDSKSKAALEMNRLWKAVTRELNL